MPKGNRWVNFYSRKIEEGGKVINVDAPLDVLPIFVAEGSVIPISFLFFLLLFKNYFNFIIYNIFIIFDGRISV